MAIPRILLPLMILTVLALVARAQQPAEDLFQQALAKERIEGRVDEAVTLYELILRDAGGNRAIAARALLQVARLHDRQRRPDARAMYERLAREFSDQPAAAAARAWLDGQRRPPAPPPGPTTRQVWGDGDRVDVSGGVSRDGRWLSFTDWSTGDLAVRDLRAGTVQRVTRNRAWSQDSEFAQESLPSPDASVVAFTWCGPDTCDLRSVNRAGGEPRVLLGHDEILYPQILDWSPDGAQLAVALARADGSHQLAVITLADRRVQVLKSLDWRTPFHAAFSPDGTHLAYDWPPAERSPERDVFLLAVDGSREVALVTHPAHDYLLGWSHAANLLLFASDRTGTNGVWGLPMRGHHPHGDPMVVRPGIGRVLPMNATAAGDYFYALGTSRRGIATATLGEDHDALAAAVEPMAGRVEQGIFSGEWSPDGRTMAYLVQSPLVRGGEGGTTLALRTAASGQTRELPLAVSYAARVRWLPTGRRLIVRGRDLKGRHGLFGVDAATGAMETLLLARVGRYDVAPDATLYYERRGTPTTIVAHDLASGRERVVATMPSPSGLAVSPDGKSIAIKVNVANGDRPVIQVLPTAGGPPRTVASLDAADQTDWRELAWTPDGRSILFTLGHGALWRVAAAGGAPVRLADGLTFINAISLHPDGRQLAISNGSSRYEVWVLEHVAAARAASR